MSKQGTLECDPAKNDESPFADAREENRGEDSASSKSRETRAGEGQCKISHWGASQETLADFEKTPQPGETVELDLSESWEREEDPKSLTDMDFGYVDEYNGLLTVVYGEFDGSEGWKAYHHSEEYHERYHLTDYTSKAWAKAAAERFARGNWYGGDFAAALHNGDISLDVEGGE